MAIKARNNPPRRGHAETARAKGFDWSNEDGISAALFNRILWQGMTGNAAYPLVRTHAVMGLHASAQAGAIRQD